MVIIYTEEGGIAINECPHLLTAGARRDSHKWGIHLLHTCHIMHFVVIFTSRLKCIHGLKLFLQFQFDPEGAVLSP